MAEDAGGKGARVKITKRQLRRVIQETMQHGIGMLNWIELQVGDLVDVDTEYNHYRKIRITQKVDDVSTISGLPPGPGFVGNSQYGDDIVFNVEDVNPESYGKYTMTEGLLRKIIREALANEYQWDTADDDNLMLKKEPGMEKSDRDNVSRYLKALGLMKGK